MVCHKSNFFSKVICHWFFVLVTLKCKVDGWMMVSSSWRPIFSTQWIRGHFILWRKKHPKEKLGRFLTTQCYWTVSPLTYYYWEVLLEICFSVITFYWCPTSVIPFIILFLECAQFGHMSREINFQYTKICQLPFPPPHKLIIVIQLHPVFWWRCLLFYEKTDNFHCYQWHERKLTMALKWNLRPSVRRHDAAAGC